MKKYVFLKSFGNHIVCPDFFIELEASIVSYFLCLQIWTNLIILNALGVLLLFFSSRSQMQVQNFHSILYNTQHLAPPQCVELALRWQFCVHGSICHEIYFQSKSWIIFDILNIWSWLWLTRKHIWNILEEIVFRNCTFLLLSKTISSIMFQICFRVSHSQDLVFKIPKNIQNFD